MASLTEVGGSIAAPAGFSAAGVAAGIKKNGNPDVALIAADRVSAAAGVFTINKARAASVRLSEQSLAATGGRARAVIVNAGCANACTGAQGDADALEMMSLTASRLGCAPEEVLVASTGVIGVSLPMANVRAGIVHAVSARTPQSGHDAAAAIMTTDPFPKSVAIECTLRNGRAFRVGGIAKGSGMIEPRMATMLAFLTTDVDIEPALLRRALVAAVDTTFNAITVDGECSTNDCAIVLASGAAGVRIEEENLDDFTAALAHVAGLLARDIVRGGEGATKLVAVRVTGAATGADAWLAARTIANSPLVKTAIHGGDPNWGRLVSAAGRSGAAFDLDRTSVSIGGVEVFAEGKPHDERADEAATVLAAKDITIVVDLGLGPHAATMWTCDFSADYVRINAEYKNMKQLASLAERQATGPRPGATGLPKDFLSVLDLTPATLEACLDTAAAMKIARRARTLPGRVFPVERQATGKTQPGRVLAGRHVALLFEKPSLRTRSTFTIAVRELGGDVIEPPADVALGGRESLADVARNLERWVDVCIVRTYEQARLAEFAAAAPRMHVVNALTNEEHPCQAIADMLTLREQLGALPGATLAYVGDGNNVAASLAQAGLMLGVNVRIGAPAGYALPKAVAEAARAAAVNGATLIETTDPFEAVCGADAVYTDVWASMGQEDEAAERDAIFRPYQVNQGLMDAAAPRALFMHCLPAHRGAEVTDAVIDGAASVVFEQAENRLHAQKALLSLLVS